MLRRSRSSLSLLGLFAFALATLLDLSFKRSTFAADTASGAYILTSGNQLTRVLDAGLITSTVAISGVVAGEELVAIAVRPQNNRLYGLASNGAGAVRLYHIDSGSGAPIATPLSAAPVQFDDGNAAVAIGGTTFDINFNPTVDRVRVLSNTGVNFRMNPNNGALVDSNPATPGINPDGALNGGSTTASATAYTNSFVNAAATTQYTLDSATGSLFIQNPPNAGTLGSGVKVTVNGANLAFTDAVLDIPSSIAVSTANAPATGLAFAAFTVDGVDSLYTLDLTSGAANSVGSLRGLDVLDMALAPAVPVGMALSGDTLSLQRFRLSQPDTIASAAITGITAGETLVGIDGRPATGQLIGVGVDALTDTASVYIIDPQTGAATVIGTPSAIAYVDAGGNPIDLPPPTVGYGVDFNPTVDRVRVVTGSGLNLRMNPVTGTAVDGDANTPGVNPDGAISGAATSVSATAYTNSYTGATLTTQYTLDSATDTLFIQNPPNSGPQTAVAPIKINGAVLDFSAANGFDIPTAVKATTANAPVTAGSAYALLSVGTTTALYQINLVSGAATNVGTLATGATGASGFVAWTPIEAMNAYKLYLPQVQQNTVQ